MHPLETIIDGDKYFTFTADEPSGADLDDFQNYEVNIISGNLERSPVIKGPDGRINTPNNKKGGSIL